MAICAQCRKRFTPKGHTEGKFCSQTCWKIWEKSNIDRGADHPLWRPESHKKSACETCGKTFASFVSRGRRFCSQECYQKSKTLEANLMKGRQVRTMLSDAKLLDLWEDFKAGKFPSLHRALRSATKIIGGGTYKRLAALVGQEEFNSYYHSIAHPNYKRQGSVFERKAKKELEASNYKVVKSSASLGVWDLWAINDKEIRLIQVKSTRSNRSIRALFAKTIDEMRSINVMGVQELWVWRIRKGWEKIIISVERQ